MTVAPKVTSKKLLITPAHNVIIAVKTVKVMDLLIVLVVMNKQGNLTKILQNVIAGKIITMMALALHVKFVLKNVQNAA